MWGNFIACLDAVLPIFGLILLGYAAKRLGLLDRGDVKKMNKVFFRFFLPVMLFYSLYTSDLNTAVQPALIAYALGCTLLIFFAALALVRRFGRYGRYRSSTATIVVASSMALRSSSVSFPCSSMVASTCCFFSSRFRR